MTVDRVRRSNRRLCSAVSQFPSRTPEASHALDATNACRQFGTQETGIRRLVRDAADGGQSKIDRGGRILPLLEVNAIAENDRPVERESRLRTVPGDELADRMVVGALAAGGRQAIQHGGLGLLEVWECQNPFGRLS